MVKTYKGRYIVKDKAKYRGDSSNVIYRSSWERAVCNFLDNSKDVARWSSEEVIIDYTCATDRKRHRYFVDFLAEMTDGSTILIEVKPAKETKQPTNVKGRPKARVLQEAATYAKNLSKWAAADKYCETRGWDFQIWTEDVLKAKGILPKDLGNKPFKPIGKLPAYRKPKRAGK